MKHNASNNSQSNIRAFAQGYGSIFNMFSTASSAKKTNEEEIAEIWREVGGYLYGAINQLKEEDGRIK